MSPAAVVGPALNSSAAALGGGPTGGYHNNPLAGRNDLASSMKQGNRVYPHIDDLLSVVPDVDIHAPLRRLLQQADLNARQAETQLDFRRPDLALQEYLKASIIAVELVPRHKDYPSLQGDRGDSHRLYAGLKKRIVNLHPRFEEVKRTIKENNAQSGVQPKFQRNGDVKHSTVAAQARVPPIVPLANPASNGVVEVKPIPVPTSIDSGFSNGMVRKKPAPAIQPKPVGLQGKSVQSPPVSPRQSTGANEDELMSRFARLRVPGTSPPSAAPISAPVQDPRIKTRPIVIPTDIPPRQTPSPGRQKPEFEKKHASARSLGHIEFPSAPNGFPPTSRSAPGPKVTVPIMPRAPDAIYSPAKSHAGLEHLDQPQSSTPTGYGLVRRQSSMASINSGTQTATLTGASGILAADVTSITAEELFQLLKARDCRVLLVDIRTRDEFDGGHIMWQSIMCVEPMVLKDGVSAKEIEESLVLSPEIEQKLFDMRSEYDAIVYYDQDSKSAQPSNFNAPYEPLDDLPLRNFQRAVYVFEYEKVPKRRPLLLVGGLDAWINLVGPGALQTSKTGAGISVPKRPKYMQELYSRRKRYVSRGLSAEEETAWAERLKEEDALSAKDKANIEGQYVKSTEDFLRRFPEPTSMKESMSGPPTAGQREPRRSDVSDTPSHDTSVPTIPTRPPPAVPRRSYSGVSSKNETAVSGTSLNAPLSSDLPPVPPGVIRGNTGLSNQNNSCYMNSVIQCLSGTAPLRDHLMQNLFMQKGPPPRKEKENSDPPQLLAKNLAQLFRHLWAGYTYITPRTLENYIRRIHSLHHVSQEDLFATGRQQDAVAYLLFLIDVLSDELNFKRDRPNLAPLSPAAEKKLMEMPLFTSSYSEWLRWSSIDDSLTMNLFRGFTCTMRECRNCHRLARNWDTWSVLQMRPNTSRSDTPQHLEDDFKARFSGSPSGSVEVRCDGCKATTNQPLVEKIIRCPNILIIQIARFRHDNFGMGSEMSKNNRKVQIPLQLDMTPYVAPFKEEDRVQAHQLPPEFRPPFKYECYAVVQHSGGLNSGHYWTLRQGENNSWWRFNDASVTPADPRDIQSTYSYILFYRRTPYPL